jgi:hypothetical protein
LQTFSLIYEPHYPREGGGLNEIHVSKSGGLRLINKTLFLKSGKVPISVIASERISPIMGNSRYVPDMTTQDHPLQGWRGWIK